jgi:dTDP-4-amino-4,6-dideoxygalactose transaminase
MSVQLFVPSFRVAECLEQIRECLEKGWTGSGFKTIEIEDKWKGYTCHNYAHFLSSNTVGLHLAFKILKDRLGCQKLTDSGFGHGLLYASRG